MLGPDFIYNEPPKMCETIAMKAQRGLWKDIRGVPKGESRPLKVRYGRETKDGALVKEEQVAPTE